MMDCRKFYVMRDVTFSCLHEGMVLAYLNCHTYTVFVVVLTIVGGSILDNNLLFVYSWQLVVTGYLLLLLLIQ